VGRLTGPIEKLHELHDPAVIVKRVAFTGTLVAEDDLHSPVQEGQFLKPTVEDVVVELGIGKNLEVGFERSACAGALRASDAAYRSGGHAAFILLLIHIAVAADFHLAPLGEEIDHGHPHAVQSAGGLIGSLLEFAPELQHAHHTLQRGEPQVGMVFHRDAAPVVLHGDRAVVVDGHIDLGSITGHHLVDGIVHHFVNQVVQAARTGIGNVHAGTLAHVFQVAQVLQVFGRVVGPGTQLFVQGVFGQFGRGVRRSAFAGRNRSFLARRRKPTAGRGGAARVDRFRLYIVLLGLRPRCAFLARQSVLFDSVF